MRKHHLLCTGGGTLGPVTPLLAMVEAARRIEPRLEVSWIGTPDGPERALIEATSISFFSLPVVKLPRYLSWKWFTFPFDWYHARREAGRLLERIRPDAVVTAGGFTGVPVIFEARRRGIPCAMHQLDLKPGLSNKQVAPHCQSVTTSFEYARSPFRGSLADERIPTPTRFRLENLPSRAEAIRFFGLDPRKPVLLVFGGGTGSLALNACMEKTQDQWLRFTQVVHLTGKGKQSSSLREKKGYVIRDFLQQEMVFAYAVADLVICRAGFGTLSEMTAALAKPTILVPLPKTEQEINAKAFEERGAVIVMEQSSRAFCEELVEAARLLLRDEEARREMGEAAQRFLPTDDGSALAKKIMQLMKK